MRHSLDSFSTLAPNAALSTAGLTPADVVAVCGAFRLPTPTPDVPLDDLLTTAGLTLPDVYEELRSATELPLMIAAAAMRGVTKLPRDARLGPQPHPISPNVRAMLPDLGYAPPPTRRMGADRAETARLAGYAPSRPPAPVASHDADAVLLTLSPCPSLPGSKRAERHALLTVGSTRAELRAAGVRDRDLERLVAGGHAVFGPRPSGS